MEAVLQKSHLIELFKNYFRPKEYNFSEIEINLENIDFPTTKDEAWRKTDLKSFRSHLFETPINLTLYDEKIIKSLKLCENNANIIVFYNGAFQPHLSNIEDRESVKISTIKDFAQLSIFYNKTQIHKTSFFTAINTLFPNDGIVIEILPNTIATKTIHVYSIYDGKNKKIAIQNRNLIIAREKSRANILFSFHSISEDVVFHNIANEIFLEQDSELNIHFFEGPGNETFLFNATKAILSENSKLLTHTFTFCGNIVRNDLKIDLNGQNSSVQLYGLYLPTKQQHFDNNIELNHIVGNTYSNQLYRGIIDDNSSAVFEGTVKIFKNASKTEAFQKNNNILLTKTAKIHSKPRMIIENDDVIASHGSTVGQIDQDALFYLRSRGISLEKAKAMILTAFCEVIANEIKINDFKNYIKFYLDKRLQGEPVDYLCSKMGICRN